MFQKIREVFDMMNKLIVMVSILIGLAGIAQAETLREQMDSMILSVADMDIMVSKGESLDYSILVEDAERILAALQKIRGLDKQGLFKTDVASLEKLAQNLLKYAKAKDARAGKLPEEIFTACFKCHTEHRAQPMPAPK